MKKTPKLSERIKSLRGDMSQAKFADLLGVQQATVSAWELEENVPSPEALMNLAKLASYPENLLYWKQAGMDKDAMLSVAEKVLQERGAPPFKGEIIRIPSIRKTAQGREEENGVHPMTPSGILNPLSTKHYVLDFAENVGGINTNKIEAILDVSETSTQRLFPFWDKVVLAEFARGAGPGEAWWRSPGRAYMGRLRCLPQEGGGGSLEYIPWFAVIGPFDDSKGSWGLDDEGACLGKWLMSMTTDKWRLKQADEYDLQLVRARAREELRPFPDCTILGRVIKWWRPPKEGK